MSIATTDAPETMEGVTAELLLSTLTGAPTDTAPTRDTEPATDGDPAETPPVAEASPPAEPAATPETPAEAPPEQPATPPARRGPHDPPETLEEAIRQITTLRGQVGNAAQQAAAAAAAKAREEALAESSRNRRDEIRQELQAMVDAGEMTLEQGNAALQRHQATWAQQDRQRQETDLAMREASVSMQGFHATAQNALVHLHDQGASQLAADTGLTVDQVREYWADEGERQRFQRAVLHHQLAQQFPGSGFNAEAMEDYLQGKIGAMEREATIRRDFTAQLAAKDREIEDLRVQLNRADAGDAAIGRSDTTPRGGGQARKAAETVDDVKPSDLLALIRRG